MIFRSDVSRALSATEIDNNFRELKLLSSTTEVGGYAPEYTPDMLTQEGSIHYLLVTDTVINKPAEATVGKYGLIVIEQDEVGSRLCVFDKHHYWKVGGSLIVDKNPGAITVIRYDIGDNEIVYLRRMF